MPTTAVLFLASLYETGGSVRKLHLQEAEIVLLASISTKQFHVVLIPQAHLVRHISQLSCSGFLNEEADSIFLWIKSFVNQSAFVFCPSSKFFNGDGLFYDRIKKSLRFHLKRAFRPNSGLSRQRSH